MHSVVEGFKFHGKEDITHDTCIGIYVVPHITHMCCF